VLDEGLALSTSVDAELVAVVLRLDGSQSGREIANELAAATGQDIGAVAARVSAFVHTLLELGMVEPAAQPSNELRATFLRDPQR
jgi:hypothetical protein